jgi:predicted nuclease with TOPRIM domain
MSCEKHSELINRVEQLESSIKELYTRITTREIDAGRVDEKLNNIKNTLDNLVSKVSELADNPGKRLNTIITAIISSVTTGIVGIILGFIFSKMKG